MPQSNTVIIANVYCLLYKLNALPLFSQLIFITTGKDRESYYPLFTYEEVEIQRENITCSSWELNLRILSDPVVLVVHSLSCVHLFETPWTAACQASLSFTIAQTLLKLMPIESVMLSNHLVCHPLLLPSTLPSIRVFSNEQALCIRWSKYWSFSFSLSPFKEYLGLISFRIDWFDILVVQGALKSFFQHHSLKASILSNSSACCMVQLSYPHMSTGKTIALTIRTFVSKVMSLLFNMLSRFVIGNPLQYSCLENPMDRRAWWAAVHGVAKIQTLLSDFPLTFHFHSLEKEMATHSSILAWRIPGTEEPVGLPSLGSRRVGHD